MARASDKQQKKMMRGIEADLKPKRPWKTNRKKTKASESAAKKTQTTYLNGMDTFTHQRMRSYLHKASILLLSRRIPIASFCKTHGLIPLGKSCAQIWRLHHYERRDACRDISSTLPPLPQSFASGWHSLPYELKLRIFSLVTGPSAHCSHTRALGWKDAELLTHRIVQFAMCCPEWKTLAEQTLYSEFKFQIKRCSLGVLMPPKMHIASVRLLKIYLGVHDKPEVLRHLLEGLRDNRHGLRVKNMEVLLQQLDEKVDTGAMEILKQDWELCARQGEVALVRPRKSEYTPRLKLDQEEKERIWDDHDEVIALATDNITFSPALIGDKEYN